MTLIIAVCHLSTTSPCLDNPSTAINLRPKVVEYCEKVYVLPDAFNLAILHHELHQRVIVVCLALLWGACRTHANDMDFCYTRLALYGYSKFFVRQRCEIREELGELMAKSLLVRRSSGHGNLRCETRKEEGGVRCTHGEQLGEVARSKGSNKFTDDGASVFWVALDCGSLKQFGELAQALFREGKRYRGNAQLKILAARQH